MTAYTRPKDSLFARAGRTMGRVAKAAVYFGVAAGLGYTANKFAPGAASYLFDRPYAQEAFKPDLYSFIITSGIAFFSALKGVSVLYGDDKPSAPELRGNRRVTPSQAHQFNAGGGA